MKKLKIFFQLLTLTTFSTSCWAPRCPVDTCLVKFEHVHSDYVNGIFSGKKLYPPKVHFLWDKNKGENNPDTDLKTTPGRKKLKKKFPWEKW